MAMIDLDTRLASFTFTKHAIQELGGQFLFDVSRLVESIGYEIKPSDDWIMGYTVQKVIRDIKNACNISNIPQDLYYTAVNMTVGYFLFALKCSGKLTEFNFDAAIKQIEEGDTSVTYAFGSGSLTPEQRFDALLDHMMNSGKSAFASHRRFKW